MKNETTIGTNIFESIIKALRYYRPYGYSLEDVTAKVKNNEIVIDSAPKTKGFFDSDGRWKMCQ